MAANGYDDINIIRSKYPKFDFPVISFGEYIFNGLNQFRDKTLFIDAKSGESLTAKEIIDKAETVAASLLKCGITKDDIILFHSDNNIPYGITQIAALFLGVTITPSKPSHNVFELQNQITDSGATFVFTSALKAPVANNSILELKNKNQVKHAFVFDGEYEGFTPYKKLLENSDNKLEKIPYFPIDPKNDIAAIIYTSGTTGLPKGAMISHYHLVSLTLSFKLAQTFRDGIFSGFYPFGHVSGLLCLGIVSVTGLGIVLIDNMEYDDILSAVEKYKITQIGVFPAFGEALLNGSLDNYDTSSIKYMFSGGSAIPSHMGSALIKKYKIKEFKEMYGMTEGFATFPNVQDYVPGDVGTVGRNSELKIIDLNTGRSLPANENGEICFRGPSMFKGYLKNPEATASTIDKDGWIHTGDVGHYNNDGHLFITDRIKEMIKYRAFTIFPVEVEDCLLKHDSIAEAIVIGVKHKIDGQWLRAYVVLSKGTEISVEEIQKFVSDRMASQKQLRGGVVFVDQIPRTIIGKSDRQYFKKLCENEILY